MKQEYAKPEIKTNAYAEFENILTHACTKQYSANGCHYYNDPIKPGKGAVDEYGDKLVGVTYFDTDVYS